MAKHRASADDQSTGEEVTERPQPAYWSVDDSRWPVVRPDLPAHMADLLAPPIVVGVARVPVTSRLTPPPEHRRNAPVEHLLAPAEHRRNAPAEHRPAAGPRAVVPAGAGGSGRRSANAPASGGRHRLPAK
ncbi:hypothetical protein GA0070606_4541 [Micromonospora citrea]|uniref:Uncharacterized protein n=1 Tax=Micromonospora citrea TaxID=47855 RepID=A0A1C6VM34_9ACTN|nr:hypothetical protein [Micromonospora citrea]SCL67389.1 hypothetical protein GA0070606_4541 [Micromonospora citrea]